MVKSHSEIIRNEKANQLEKEATMNDTYVTKMVLLILENNIKMNWMKNIGKTSSPNYYNRNFPSILSQPVFKAFNISLARLSFGNRHLGKILFE